MSQEITRYNRKLLGFPQLPHTVKYADLQEVVQSLQRFCKGLSFLTFAFVVIIIFVVICLAAFLINTGALVRSLQEKCICLV